MPRGGRREGAGRKTTWVSGRKIERTTVIRVPKEFASELLEMAHKLDAGERIDFVTDSSRDIVTQSKEDVLLSEIAACWAKWKAGVDNASLKSAQWIKARQMVKDLEPLLADIQVIIEKETESIKESIDLVVDSIAEQPGQKVNDSVMKSKEENLEKETESFEADTDLVTNSVAEQAGQQLSDSVTDSEMTGAQASKDSVTESKEEQVEKETESIKERVDLVTDSLPEQADLERKDSVTNSKSVPEVFQASLFKQHGLETAGEKKTPEDLAKVLGVTRGTLMDNKSKMSEEEYIAWLRRKDPENAWFPMKEGRRVFFVNSNSAFVPPED